jgi:putative two-component system response regulator
MDHADGTQSQILVVGHDTENGARVARILQHAGYGQPLSATDVQEALCYVNTSWPSLVVLDAGRTGEDLCAFLQHLDELAGLSSFLPVLVLCADLDPERGGQAVDAGASAFARRDVGPHELRLHVSALLSTRSRLMRTKEALEEALRARTRETEQAHLDTVAALSKVAELRDDNKSEHTARVGRLSGAIAQALHLPPEQARLIMYAARLHDIGNVAISDDIWLKRADLSESEREMMQQHTLLGAEILAGGRSELIKIAEEIAAHHHERWDGQGYPSALRGTDIPLPSRIVSVADAYDAMTHEHPHEEESSVQSAIGIMEQERGWQFDPDVVDAFFQVLEQGIVHEPDHATVG